MPTIVAVTVHASGVRTSYPETDEEREAFYSLLRQLHRAGRGFVVEPRGRTHRARLRDLLGRWL